MCLHEGLLYNGEHEWFGCSECGMRLIPRDELIDAIDLRDRDVPFACVANIKAFIQVTYPDD